MASSIDKEPPERLPKRDWRVDLLVKDRCAHKGDAGEALSNPSVAQTTAAEPQTQRSASTQGSRDLSWLAWLTTSPSADNAGTQTSSLQPSFDYSGLESSASMWFRCRWFAQEGEQGWFTQSPKEQKSQPKVEQSQQSAAKPPCFLPEGMTLDVHGVVLGASQAVDVFRGILTVLFTCAQVILVLSSPEQRVQSPVSLVVCNMASFQCCAGLMLAWGHTCYGRFLREWPDPPTHSWSDLFRAFLLPLVSAWICSFAFCFLDPKASLDDPAEAFKQVILFGGYRIEGTEILLAFSINFAVIFILWHPLSSLINGTKVRVWHDALALAVAFSPLAMTFCLHALGWGQEESGSVRPVLFHLLHANLGIILAACWDRFLSQLRPVGYRTLSDSVHLLPWDIFKGWSTIAVAVWWMLFLFFVPLAQVGASHDLISQHVSTPMGQLQGPALGVPSPLWMLASLWPLAVFMNLSCLLVTLQKFSAVLRWMQTELWHIGQNVLYYMVVINIFLASQQRGEGYRGSASLSKCLLGAASMLGAGRFLHFMAGLSQKAARE